MNIEQKPRFWLWDMLNLGVDIRHFKTLKDLSSNTEVKIFFNSRFVLGVFFEHGKHILTRQIARGPHDSLLGYEHIFLCSTDLHKTAA